MRIIFGLAVAAAALAIATAAQARPGGGGQGYGGGQAGGWSKGPSYHYGRGGHDRARPGAIRGERRHGRFGRSGYQVYGGIGIAGPVGEVDPYGNGFFKGGGGQVRLRGGQPHFDYDRSYPYEWGSAADRGTAPERTEEALPAQPGPRCTFEIGVRVCRGW